MAEEFIRIRLTRLNEHRHVFTVDTFRLWFDESFCTCRFTWVQPLKMRESRVVTMATLRWGCKITLPSCPTDDACSLESRPHGRCVREKWDGQDGPGGTVVTWGTVGTTEARSPACGREVSRPLCSAPSCSACTTSPMDHRENSAWSIGSSCARSRSALPIFVSFAQLEIRPQRSARSGVQRALLPCRGRAATCGRLEGH